MSGGGTRHHILVRAGDATTEVNRVVREIGSPQAAGLHRHFFVTRANQTVVMATSHDAPVARALRLRPGWTEPEAGPD